MIPTNRCDQIIPLTSAHPSGRNPLAPERWKGFRPRGRKAKGKVSRKSLGGFPLRAHAGRSSSGCNTIIGVTCGGSVVRHPADCATAARLSPCQLDDGGASMTAAVTRVAPFTSSGVVVRP